MNIIRIPGFGDLELETLILDYNGTIAMDGELIEGISDRVIQLSKDFDIVVLTADTHGTCRSKLSHLPVRVEVIGLESALDSEIAAKHRFVESCGRDRCVAIGNGRNDSEMLDVARLGIAVLQSEGSSVSALLHADVVVHSILDALDLLIYPKRLIATLRS